MVGGEEKENHSVAFIVAGVIIVVIAAFAWFLMNQILNSTTDLYIKGNKFTAVVVKDSVGQASDWAAGDQTVLLEFANDGRWAASSSELKNPVDIVWLDSNKKVVCTMSGVTPQDNRNLTPSSMAKYAVELPAGTLKTQSIGVGDTIAF